MQPTIHIGKSGLTQSVKEEIIAQLKKRKFIKIRILRTAKPEDAKSYAKQLAAAVNATLIQQVGNTITLQK